MPPTPGRSAPLSAALVAYHAAQVESLAGQLSAAFRRDAPRGTLAALMDRYAHHRERLAALTAPPP